jgi:hypothetical protein
MIFSISSAEFYTWAIVKEMGLAEDDSLDVWLIYKGANFNY